MKIWLDVAVIIAGAVLCFGGMEAAFDEIGAGRMTALFITGCFLICFGLASSHDRE